MKKLVLLFSMAVAALNAEVTEVRLTWTPSLCNDICIKNLEKQFHRIYNVDQITINKGAGQALLKYKTGGVYNFAQINIAMEMIGLTINDIHVTVKGHIKATSKDLMLISDGDASVFVLMSPVRAETQRYVENYNPDTHQLTPQLRNQLMEAVQGGKLVTIQGQLFEPERSPPNYLIVQDIKMDTGSSNTYE